jgi:hypothetical protein
MCMEQWWNDTIRGRSQYSDRKLSQCHSLSQIPNTTSRNFTRTSMVRRAINLLSHTMAHCSYFLKASNILFYKDGPVICLTRPPTAAVYVDYLPSAELLFKAMHDSKYCILWAGCRQQNGSKWMNHYQAQRRL